MKKTLTAVGIAGVITLVWYLGMPLIRAIDSNENTPLNMQYTQQANALRDYNADKKIEGDDIFPFDMDIVREGKLKGLGNADAEGDVFLLRGNDGYAVFFENLSMDNGADLGLFVSNTNDERRAATRIKATHGSVLYLSEAFDEETKRIEIRSSFLNQTHAFATLY